ALEDANQVAQSALDKARAEVAEREQAAKASVTEARDALAQKWTPIIGQQDKCFPGPRHLFRSGRQQLDSTCLC
ncbi:hypothetical protein, partial [Thiolapillus sp.]|uniref:hypothetical protein n=1 Tax=Thiolapillus sp. TaxID=2017437 RepID=UPI003AF9CFCE